MPARGGGCDRRRTHGGGTGPDRLRADGRPFAAPKGVPEYFPPESAGFEYVRNTLQTAADRAGYGLIELPVFEETGLYARGVGESTDVVSKEMYTFADRGDRSVTLRPEGTAGVVRAVIEHGLDRAGLPVKLRYAGPFFRYERPQAGRYRQLQQVGVEAIGVDDPALDAEVIAVADEGFRALGLTGYRLELTSLGDADCRPAYGELLRDFLAGLDLDEPTRHRAQLNPLRVLDDKRPEVRALVAEAPLLVDHLSPASAAHHAAVKQHLDDLGVAYVENPRMVRGLDYYTKTTFEFVHDGLGAQSGIGGGGRYDGLMAVLGGQPLSGVGYGIGVDRTLLACRVEGMDAPWSEARCDVFGVPLGDAARSRLVVIAAGLRRAGVRVDLAYGGRGLKGAMKAADRSGARVRPGAGRARPRGRAGRAQGPGDGGPDAGAAGRCRRRGGRRAGLVLSPCGSRAVFRHEVPGREEDPAMPQHPTSEHPTSQRPSRQQSLSTHELTERVESGDVDTVLVVFTDMQGRLQGKRVHAQYFLDEVSTHGTEGCNYLLAVDVDMNTVSGYEMSSWEQGYGDFVHRPRTSTTLRRRRGCPASAMVQCDLAWLDGTPVRQSPRQVLRPRSTRRRGSGSPPSPAPSWSSSCSRHLRGRRGTRTTGA